LPNKPKELTVRERMIVDEYLHNGFNKTKAYKKYHSDFEYKNANSLTSTANKFFNRPKVKEYLNSLMDSAIGDRETLINELLYKLKDDYFNRPSDSSYTQTDRNNDLKMLVKISGIDKAPKFKDEAIPNEKEIHIIIE
jgi:phage terminase small subunit